MTEHLPFSLNELPESVRKWIAAALVVVKKQLGPFRMTSSWDGAQTVSVFTEEWDRWCRPIMCQVGNTVHGLEYCLITSWMGRPVTQTTTKPEGLDNPCRDLPYYRR